MVDQMEIWEVASALGEATADWEEWNQEYSRVEHEYENGENNPDAPAANVKWGNDVLAQRVAASKGDGPPPEARVMGQIETAELMRRLNGD